jgi:hypothetical protein
MARDIGQLPKDIQRKLESIDREMQRRQRTAIKKAGERAAEVQRSRIARDTGGDSRLSGVNKSKGRAGNAAVGVRVRVHGGGGDVVSVELLATGPLQIINNPTAGHVIRSAYVKGRSANKRKGTSLRSFIGPVAPGQTRADERGVINIPGVGFRRSARHPGTKGKGTWQKGRSDALPEVVRVLGREMDEAFRRGARGGS